MTSDGRRRLAVLGSPIAHSKSPAIHAAAYRTLGLDWDYGRCEVAEGGLAAFVDGLDGTWRGLSLTMPLKREALRLDARNDPQAVTVEVGQANTLLFDASGITRFTTDPYGIENALAAAGVERASTGTVLGGGATAESAAYALRYGLGAAPTLAARSPTRVYEGPFARVPLLDADLDVEVVVSTIPGGVELPLRIPHRVHGVLLDVVYDPWPTPLAAAWSAAGGRVVSGLEMLLHQALAQVRIFVGGDPASALPDEPEVWEAMRAAVGLGRTSGSAVEDS